MINLRWAPFPSAVVSSYKVYRSMIGFRGLVVAPDVVEGKTLLLKMNGGALQTLTFTGPASVVNQITSKLTGGKAFLSFADPLYFYVRSNIRSSPGSIQIVGGTALADLQLTMRTITEKSEDMLLATVPALPDPEMMVEWQDLDGVPEDFYAVSSVDPFGNESLKTAYRQATAYTGSICVLEGIVTDLQGVRFPDATITIQIIRFPVAQGKVPQITRFPLSFKSGPDGRFSIPVLQGALVQFEIKECQFSREIEVPALAYEFLTDILVDLDYRYPLEYKE
jgi:hypothetical protein